MSYRTWVSARFKELISTVTSPVVTENYWLLEGTPCLVSSEQDHYAHLLTHLRLLAQGVLVFARNSPRLDVYELRDVFNIGTFGVPHFEEHLRSMGQLCGGRDDMQRFIAGVAPVYEYAVPVVRNGLQRVFSIKQKGNELV